MAKKDLEVKWSSDHQKVIDGFAKVIAKNEQAIAKLKQTNREAKKTKKGVAGVGDAAKKTGAGIKSWVGSFIGISSVLMALRAIIAEMKEADRLRKGMHETALSVEQWSLKIANLRGNVSREGIAAVTKDIADIAKQTHIGLDVAAQALFFSGSAMGPGRQWPKRAMAIGQLAAPPGLAPEEVKMIPKLFSVMGAKTERRQMQILNQVYAATKSSIAEMGEYLQPFISTVVSDIERGFTIQESLARMTAMIETTGSVADAATASRRVVDIAAGKTKSAMAFLTGQAKERGVEYGKLTDPQRLKFVGRLYEEYKTTGRMDILKTQLDVKGFAAIRAFFSEVGKKKYAETLPQIQAAAGSGAVERMAGQFGGTLTAGKVGREITRQIADTRTGIERDPQIVFKEVALEISKQAKARESGFGEWAGWAMDLTEGLEMEKAGRILLRENLALAVEREKPGSKKREYLEGLFRESLGKTWPSIHPDYLEKVYKATEGLSLIEKRGELADSSTMQKLMQGRMTKGLTLIDQMEEKEFEEHIRTERYMKGIRNYFGLEEGGGAEGAPSEATDKLVKALDRTTAELEKINQRIPAGSNVDRGDVD